MKRTTSLLLAGLLLWTPALASQDAPGKKAGGERKSELKSEDLPVIRMMELLELMELLRDMDILEGAPRSARKEKQ